MSLLLSDILSLNVLDSYEIVAGKTFLNREVLGISLLETPDFEKYIQDKTLILTTLYPIQSDVELFKKLIRILHQRTVAGMVVKLKRYIDTIPNGVVELAEALHFPLITIEYDANLSDISTRILNELTRQNLRSSSLSSLYIDLIKTLDEKNKVDTILTFKDRFENLDFWIYSEPQEKTFSTDTRLNTIAEKIAFENEVINKYEDYYVYLDSISLSNHMLYKVVFFAQEKHQSKIYYYAEIIKMMLVFVYQKRQEVSLQQNQFLTEIMTSGTSPFTTNEMFAEKAELYGWNVLFPLTMVICQLNFGNLKQKLDGEDLRDIFAQDFALSKAQIRYVVINQRIVLMINGPAKEKMESKLRNLIERFENQHPRMEMKLAFTSNIHHINDLAPSYSTLTRGLNLITQKHFREKVFTEHSVKMLSILGKVAENDLKEYVHMVLGPLLDYELKHGGDLLETLHMLITQQFHLKKTANALYIHYNTLRHRMEILEYLGFTKNQFESNHYDLIFAVYLAKNLMMT